MKDYKMVVHTTRLSRKKEILEKARKLGYISKGIVHLPNEDDQFYCFTSDGGISYGTDWRSFTTAEGERIMQTEFLKLQPEKPEKKEKKKKPAKKPLIPMDFGVPETQSEVSDLDGLASKIIEKNPTIILTGSFALEKQNYPIGRKITDLDFLVPADTKLWVPSDAISMPIESEYTNHLNSFKIEGVKCDFIRIGKTPPQVYVSRDGDSFGLINLIDDIMKRKEEAMKNTGMKDASRIKHLTDLLKYYKDRSTNYPEITGVIDPALLKELNK